MLNKLRIFNHPGGIHTITVVFGRVIKELKASAETSLASRSNRQSGRSYGVGNTRCNELAVRIGAEDRTEVACGSDQGSGVLLKFAFEGEPNELHIKLV